MIIDEERRDDGDLERDPGAVEEAQELVAAERVRAAEHEQHVSSPSTDPVTPGSPADGRGQVGVDRAVGPTKIAFGPCPSQRWHDRRADEGARTRRMMKIPLAIATLSRLNRRQTCSQ